MKRRHFLGVSMAHRVPVVRPLDERYELPPIKRDYRMTVAAICGILVSIGFVAALVMAMVASR